RRARLNVIGPGLPVHGLGGGGSGVLLVAFRGGGATEASNRLLVRGRKWLRLNRHQRPISGSTSYRATRLPGIGLALRFVTGMAKVSARLSASSGDLIPRFFMSSFDSNSSAPPL